jgi:hypothetical protein
MNWSNVWTAFTRLSFSEMAALGLLMAIALAALSVAAIAYGRIVLDEWKTRRIRSRRVKAYNDGHRRPRPASAEVTIE